MHINTKLFKKREGCTVRGSLQGQCKIYGYIFILTLIYAFFLFFYLFFNNNEDSMRSSTNQSISQS